MTTKEAVMDKLDDVEDPELELSIVELGLVYDVRFEEKDEGLHAEVDLTLTSPAALQPRNHGRCSPCCAPNRWLGLGHINLVGPHAGTPKSTPAKTLAWTWAFGIEGLIASLRWTLNRSSLVCGLAIKTTEVPCLDGILLLFGSDRWP